MLIFKSLSIEFTATCNNRADGRKKCVFPFKFKGREYTECTWDWAFVDRARNDRAWCGTRGEAGWSNGWGDCGEGCTIPGEEKFSNN